MSVDVGTLAGRMELEDAFTATADLIIKRINDLDEKFGGFGKHVAEQATSFFTAEAAFKAVEKAAEFLGEELTKLTIGGAGVADVEENFNRLTRAAGLTGQTLLTSLREGTHNTISDFELMKMVNQDLAAGMNLTDKEFRQLAEGAFALAQRNATGVAEGLTSMNDAMLTGRVRALNLLTGRIDLNAAEEKFAASIKTTSDHLSAEGKTQAARVAILQAVGNATERLGEQTDGLDERVDQARTFWANFEEELGKTIASSPVIMAGIDGVRDALIAAFGGDKETLIKNIAIAVDKGAIELMEFAKIGVDAAGVLGMTYNDLQNVFEHVVSGIQAITYGVENSLLAIAKVANTLPGTFGAFDDEIKFLTNDTDRLYNSMAQGEKVVEQNRQEGEQWAVTTGKINEQIDVIKQRMEAAGKATLEHAEKTEESAGATEHLGRAMAGTSEYVKTTTKDIANNKKEMEEAARAWAAYDAELAKSGGNSLAAQRAAIEQWHQDQISKLDLTTNSWEQHWKAIEATVTLRLKNIGIKTDELYNNSRTKRQDDLESAQKTFEEAMAHSSDYSRDYLDKLRSDRDAAKEALISYGDATVHELDTIQKKADTVNDHVMAIQQPIVQMLGELSKAEFQQAGGEQKLAYLEQLYAQYPGRKSGQGGATGLMSNDLQGYLEMLKEQQTYQLLKNYVEAHKQELEEEKTAKANRTANLMTHEGSSNATVVTNAPVYTGKQENHFNINSTTPKQVADEVANILMSKAFLGRQFPQPSR